MEDSTEYQLATLDGDIFFSASENDFSSVAIAAFTKLAELCKEDGANASRIAIEVRINNSSSGSTNRGSVSLGYLGWNLQAKL